MFTAERTGTVWSRLRLARCLVFVLLRRLHSAAKKAEHGNQRRRMSASCAFFNDDFCSFFLKKPNFIDFLIIHSGVKYNTTIPVSKIMLYGSND